MKRPLRLLTIAGGLAVIVAVPATVAAAGFNAESAPGSHMSGSMDGRMGMMGQMHGSAEDHEEMMQLCAAHMEEGHEGMMDQADGMGMTSGIGMMQ